MHTEGEALVVVGGCNGLVLEGRGEIPVDAERRAERRVKCRAIWHEDAIEEWLQWAVRLTFDLVENVRGVHGAVGGARQAGRKPGALVGEMSRVGTGTDRGKVSWKVWSLLWQERPRVQLQAARHQISGRLRQTWQQKDND